MRRVYAAAAGLALLSGGLLLGRATQADTEPAGANVGRYKVARTELVGKNILVDSVTGDTWMLCPHAVGGGDGLAWCVIPRTNAQWKHPSRYAPPGGSSTSK
jgi:hypothetical protein